MPDNRRKANKNQKVDTHVAQQLQQGEDTIKSPISSRYSVNPLYIDESISVPVDYNLLAAMFNKANPHVKKICIDIPRDTLFNWFEITDKKGNVIEDKNSIVQEFTEEFNLQQLLQIMDAWEINQGWAIIVDWERAPPAILTYLTSGLSTTYKSNIKYEVFHRNTAEIEYDYSTGSPLLYKVRKIIGDREFEIAVPAEFCYHYATRTYNHPFEGTSLLSYCYNDLLYVWLLTRDAFKTYEKYGKGFPVFENDGASGDDVDDAETMLKKMRQITGIVTPEHMKFRFEGINGKHLDPQVFYDIFVTNIACAVDLPVDEFRGIYQGERQAADVALTSKWQMIKGRQKLIDNVIRRLLIDSKILEDSNTWMIKWVDPFEQKQEQKETSNNPDEEDPNLIEDTPDKPIDEESIIQPEVKV